MSCLSSGSQFFELCAMRTWFTRGGWRGSVTIGRAGWRQWDSKPDVAFQAWHSWHDWHIVGIL
jgi:hypothetical protein